MILIGNSLDVLPTLPAESVQACITSPPYWGLRDYGVPPVEWPEVTFVPVSGLPPITIPAGAAPLGLEPDPWAFVGHMVAIFREVYRVLRTDGTLWLNLGDSYCGSAGGWKGGDQAGTGSRTDTARIRLSKTAPGLARKDLVGIPWRVVFALQADGWIHRTDVVWHKRNPHPESVRDRPTRAHEFFFMLTKDGSYYYDPDAITEPVSPNSHARTAQNVNRQAGSMRSRGGVTGKPMKAVKRARKAEVAPAGVKSNGSFDAALCELGDVRNARTVWSVATKGYKGAHFATYPPELIRRPILASTRPGDTILDPFGGSGTTARTALEFGRKAIHVDVNPSYRELADERTTGFQPGLL